MLNPSFNNSCSNFQPDFLSLPTTSTIMKQKIVIRMSMNGHRSRSKAMQIVFTFPGVEKAELEWSGKDRIEVTGDEVDSVALAILLRKRFGSAELLSVSPVKEKEAAQSGNPQSEIQHWHHGPLPDPYYPNCYCSIM